MLHAVAVKKGAVKQLLACCQAAAGRDARQCELAAPATCVLTLVLGFDAARDEFAEQNGAYVLRLLLETSAGKSLSRDRRSSKRPPLQLCEAPQVMERVGHARQAHDCNRISCVWQSNAECRAT